MAYSVPPPAIALTAAFNATAITVTLQDSLAVIAEDFLFTIWTGVAGNASTLFYNKSISSTGLNLGAIILPTDNQIYTSTLEFNITLTASNKYVTSC